MKYTLIVISAFLFNYAHGQFRNNLLNNSGGSLNSQHYSLTFSAGEPVVSSQLSQNYRLSGGFISQDLNQSLTSFIPVKKDPYSISPNPFNQKFELTFPAAETHQIEISGPDGAIVLKTICNQQDKLNIEVPGPSGIYLVRIFNENNSSFYSYKIIKI
jgi:hypothetical protein